jgi:hypothetical protein
MRPVAHPTVTCRSNLNLVWNEAASSCRILATLVEEQPALDRDVSASHGLSPPPTLHSPALTRS